MLMGETFTNAVKFRVVHYRQMNPRENELLTVLQKVQEEEGLSSGLLTQLIYLTKQGALTNPAREELRDMIVKQVISARFQKFYALDNDLIRAYVEHQCAAPTGGLLDPLMTAWTDEVVKMMTSDDLGLFNSQNVQNIWVYGPWYPLYTTLASPRLMTLPMLGTVWRVVEKLGTRHAEQNVAKHLLQNPTVPICLLPYLADVARVPLEVSNSHIKHTQELHPELTGLPRDLVVETAINLPVPTSWTEHLGFTPAGMVWSTVPELEVADA